MSSNLDKVAVRYCRVSYFYVSKNYWYVKVDDHHYHSKLGHGCPVVYGKTPEAAAGKLLKLKIQKGISCEKYVCSEYKDDVY